MHVEEEMRYLYGGGGIVLLVAASFAWTVGCYYAMRYWGFPIAMARWISLGALSILVFTRQSLRGDVKTGRLSTFAAVSLLFIFLVFSAYFLYQLNSGRVARPK